jgi:RNA polymerase sigma factor (sigma-70 family)
MKKATFYPDEELVTLLKSNNKAAYEYLYNQYAPALYGIIRKIIKDNSKAEDVMQDSFIKIWKFMDRYDANKGTLFTWMLSITRRTALDRLKADRRFEMNRSCDTIHGNELEVNPVFISLPTIDLKSIVEKLLPERKQLIELVYYEGYTHEQASEHLCIPLGTVKSRIRKAIQELRQTFDVCPASLQFA